MSIHKSQGQTLERVRVDLARIFEKGQGIRWAVHAHSLTCISSRRPGLCGAVSSDLVRRSPGPSFRPSQGSSHHRPVRLTVLIIGNPGARSPESCRMEQNSRDGASMMAGVPDEGSCATPPSVFILLRCPDRQLSYVQCVCVTSTHTKLSLRATGGV